MKTQSHLNVRIAPPSSRERGAILFIGLILLIVLSFLGFTALRASTMQERMSGNLRDREIAFQAAESALRAAEVYLAKTPTLPAATTFDGSTCGAKGVYKMTSGVPYFVNAKSGDGGNPDFWNQYPWEDTQKKCSYSGSTDYVTYVSDSDLGKPGKPVKQPRYVIEEIPANGTGLPSYRVTAKGWGSSDNAVVILQATYVSN